MSKRLLEVENLKKYYPLTAGLLSKHVADVKAVDKMGRSALAMAKKKPRNDDVIQLLIDAGAEE